MVVVAEYGFVVADPEALRTSDTVLSIRLGELSFRKLKDGLPMVQRER